jgi:hypothetical protein
VCGGETPVCFREEGHAPRCGAADANASGYPCTSAADCGEGMKCTGYRDLAPSTSCAFEPGPAEEGVTCLSDKECEGLFGANGLKLHCDRPEGNAPPSVRFCRVRSGH